MQQQMVSNILPADPSRPLGQNTTFSEHSHNSVGAKSQIFSSVAPPQEENLGHYFQSGTCLGALKTHVLLSFLWSIFCKRPVTNVTLLT